MEHPTRTEKRYLVLREENPTILAFAIEELMKEGFIDEKEDCLKVNTSKLEEDIPVYYRVILTAFGMERKKDKQSIRGLIEELRKVEIKFFTMLRSYVKDYYDFEAERRINFISAISWLVVLIGWLPILLLKGTAIYPYLMWFWIFGAPLIAGIITLQKTPLTEEGRKILQEQTDNTIKNWKPENEFIRQVAIGLKHYRSNWLEKIAAKGTGRKEARVIKWW